MVLHLMIIDIPCYACVLAAGTRVSMLSGAEVAEAYSLA